MIQSFRPKSISFAIRCIFFFLVLHEMEDIRQQLLQHDLYHSLSTIEDVKLFMTNHVLSVWTFMCLLKTLLYHLRIESSTQIGLWHPSTNSRALRILLEILMEEETDEIQGTVMSHLELYMKGMTEVGACVAPIQSILDTVHQKQEVTLSMLQSLEIEPATIEYVYQHLHIIQNWTFQNILVYFAFGRELLIPNMFEPLLKCIQKHQLHCPLFVEYMERHIDIDVVHGKKMMMLIKHIDCTHKEDIIYQAYTDRKMLWDGIVGAIQKNRIGKYVY